MVPTPTSTLCGSPTVLSIPLGSTVSAEPGIHLGRKVIPSARMEALMQHYKADWARRDGFDPPNLSAAQIEAFLHSLFDTHGLSPQTVKGYITCLGSGLNRTGKALVVQHKTISDMIASMELQRPRITPVLPQTVFLLAMASAGRRSELQALVFDQNYIQFKPVGAGVMLYFSPEFMRKNQKLNQVNNPWYIPAVPTGKSEFGAPNCPVRALRYYHRYQSEHPELRKGRHLLFIPIKDNNARKELSAATISRWICTTIIDSHATCRDDKNISVKANEVQAVATSLQLFNKVDLQTKMKAGKWSFASFYLRDLCPQTDSLQEKGPLVAARSGSRKCDISSSLLR